MIRPSLTNARSDGNYKPIICYFDLSLVDYIGRGLSWLLAKIIFSGEEIVVIDL